MVGLIVFLSVFAAMGLAWCGVTIGYVMRIGGFDRLLSLPVPEFILISAGLFCPILILAFGVAFVWIVAEMRKTQLLLNMHLRKEKTSAKVTQEPKAEQIELPLSESRPVDEKPTEPTIHDRPVLNISTQESMEKYKDISLPENLDLHFVDKT